MARPRVIVVGGGFGGLTIARGLKRAPVDVTLIDQTNHHLFQPLLYQVATAGLSLPEIAVPIRSIFDGQPNVRTLYGEVTGVDLETRQVKTADGVVFPYEYLVIAAGMRTNYFGHDSWKEHSFGLKTAEDALALREHVLRNFELAEATADADKRRTLLTSVVIGGGPTGVELAGAISELSRRVLLRDFRRITGDMVRVILDERSPRVLGAFDERLSRAAQRQLAELGVELQLGRSVTNIDATGVTIDGHHLPAGTVAWTSGVAPVPLATRIATNRDRMQRIIVNPDCSLAGHSEVFAIGDIAAYVPQGSAEALPGLAPVAIQQARYVAKLIDREARARRNDDIEDKRTSWQAPPRKPFHYVDKGIMATVGRSRAVMQFKGLRWSGFFAWLAWLVVHIFFLVGFRTRVLVIAEWAWLYLRNARGSRIISEPWSPNFQPQPPTRPSIKDTPSGTNWTQGSNGRPS